jgi:hypothetical protein
MQRPFFLHQKRIETTTAEWSRKHPMDQVDPVPNPMSMMTATSSTMDSKRSCGVCFPFRGAMIHACKQS